MSRTNATEPTSRARPRNGDGRMPADTRSALIDVGTQLFFERGFDASSVQEIVDAASLTKGALYHYFRSKEELLFEIQLTQVRLFNQTISAIVARHEAPEAMMRDIVVEMLGLVADYRREIAIFFSERRFMTEEAFSAIQAEREQFERTVTGVIQEGIDQGVFRPVASARLLAFGIIGMCAWAYQWYNAGGRLHAEDLGAMYADTILHGLIDGSAGGASPRSNGSH